MVEYYPLDKIYKEGVDYSTPDDEYLLISGIGTDSADPTDLEIDGVDTGKIITELAPLKKIGTNLLGILLLGDLLYVIPPRKRFRVAGAAGATMRVKGKIGKLGVGEEVPAEDLARFEPRGIHHLTYISGSYTLTDGTTWANKAEYEVFKLTPKTIETFIFNNYVGVNISGDTPGVGDFGVRFYVEGVPQDILTRPAGMLGIDSLSMPKPPKTTTNMTEFTLKDTPIEVTGDRTVKICVSNESGGVKDTGTANPWTIDIVAVVEYLKK